jgi:small basic protein
VIFLPLIALIAGIAVALAYAHPAEGISGQYMAIACIAGLDTICGGIRSGIEGKFHNDVFVTGFVSNILIAFFLAWLGDQIGINLFLAAVLVMGTRIFTNLSLIRRFALTQWIDRIDKKKALKQAAGQTNT